MAYHLQGGSRRHPRHLETAHGGEQRLGIRVMRRREDFLHRALLHDLPEIHDRHPVRDMAHQRQVMADEDHGRAAVPLNVEQKRHDRRLHRNVERGDRFIRHDEFRAGGKGARDGDALLLPAGELRGPPRGKLHRQANGFEQFARAGIHLSRRPGEAELCKHTADRPADAMRGIERAVRILEHHLHGALSRLVTATLARFGQQLAAEADAAGCRRVEPRDDAGKGGLAAAGLANSRGSRPWPLRGQADRWRRACGHVMPHRPC